MEIPFKLGEEPITLKQIAHPDRALTDIVVDDVVVATVSQRELVEGSPVLAAVQATCERLGKRER
jgi:hypothetical protein